MTPVSRRTMTGALIAMTLLLAERGLIARAQSGVPDLVRRADYIGFVQATPITTDPRQGQDWRQTVLLSWAIDGAIHGRIDPTVIGGRPEYRVYADAAAALYPTAMPEKGEYLVFLHRGMRHGQAAWLTDAAFPVRYGPDVIGRIVGRVAFREQPLEMLDPAVVRALLVAVTKNTAGAPPEAAHRLTRLLRAAENPPRAEAVTTEQRLTEVQRLAGRIPVGTTRADVEKVFPTEDGGASTPMAKRYYCGAGVMVDVRYDQPDGEYRVSGPIRVYRSQFHFD